MSSATTTIRLCGLGDVRRAFAAALDRQLVEVESAFASLRRDPDDPVPARRALGLLQQMEASSTPWGFASVGRAASYLKALLRACPDGGRAAREILRTETPLHLEEMHRALGPRPGPSERDARRLLFLVESPAAAPAGLAEALRRYGYDVRSFDSASRAREGLAAARPAAVLLDLPLPAGVSGLDSLRAAGVPLLLVTDRGDLAARLEAVRAGADGLFERDGDVGALLDRLERMTVGAAPEPYGVLVVDDDPVVGELHAATLRAAGMRVRRVSDPLEVMVPLRELSPDVILLDMELGACSGRELAAAIRQQDEFVATPIVFLSSVAEFDRQLEARRAGAEDFLLKPVSPDRLVAEVSLRAARARGLRAHLLRDGQTGLLGPAAFHAQLRQEVERARRQGRPLAVVRIGLDGLDASGSAAADGLVRAFSRLLRHRLRGTDFAGRCGPHSFGAALLDCDGPSAARVLEDVAGAFAELRREGHGTAKEVGLRAGLAAFPDYPETMLLLDAAEKALLRGRREGGARVVLAHA